MTQKLHITLAQANPIVGDIAHNAALIRAARDNAPDADLIVFPETVLSGYPAEDMNTRPLFLRAVADALAELVQESAAGGPALLVTAPLFDNGAVYNAAHLIDSGNIIATIRKSNLPNYGVFDEKRIFTAGPLPAAVNFRGHKIGIMICEDMWSADAAAALKKSGATMLIVPNASPFETGKHARRIETARARVAETGLPLLYVNQIGGQDDLVFDGGSFVMNTGGTVIFNGEHFASAQYDTAWSRERDGRWLIATPPAAPAPVNEIYEAAILGLRDYVTKSGFSGVLLGMSGGIDSALSAAIAVDALGAEAVQAVMLPSVHTSDESINDARECSDMLGIRHDTLSIRDMVTAAERELAPHLPDHTPPVTFENIQPRARGMLLMALSNASGRMLLSTGNKSEVAVGYSTLYGDMCGGYNPLKDIYKTQVYELARWRNENRPPHGRGPEGVVIPENIITKAPTAELRPDQTDQDSLPPYDILDAILTELVEGQGDIDALTASGIDRTTVMRVWRMLDMAEYKRRQACPGPKISPRAFDRERRFPIINRLAKHVENQGQDH